jgi:hypothetical protein
MDIAEYPGRHVLPTTKNYSVVNSSKMSIVARLKKIILDGLRRIEWGQTLC